MTGNPRRYVAPAALIAALLAPAMPAGAWGPDGHGAIGVLAVERAGHGTRQRLAELLGGLEEELVAERCNWPDSYRDSNEGEWSAPLHYVNIPHGQRSYDADRDCPSGLCVVAAVRRYAARLADEAMPPRERVGAFSFLCHFAGDLHQPLHVGYAEDRGGNLRRVFYAGQETNLHSFWDTALIERRAGSRAGLLRVLRERRGHPPKAEWAPGQISEWANESFTFTRLFAYPEDREIDPAFEQRSWNVVRQQLDIAATRLAAILDAAMATKGEN